MLRKDLNIQGKKDILKSHKDGSFAKFINEIRKRQINKHSPNNGQ